ncbi:MAG: OB-fold domain-containing protein [Actinomycetota bacterium]|nr:OB-fold domain-containing protein [Actinomycetota bacterium]
MRAQPPVIVEEDRWFWEGVDDGRLLLHQCARCERLQHPPSPMCPQCGSLEWTTQQMSGQGRVHTWIVSQHPTQPDDDPRITALIALNEGPRLVSNLTGIRAADVANDMPVEVVFVDVAGVRLPQFRPAEHRPAPR